MTASRQIPLVGLLLILVLLPDQSLAQIIPPPPAKRYRVSLHYRIDAPPAARIPAFLRLQRALEDIGFVRDPGPEDEPANSSYTRITGTIAATNAHRLLRVSFIRGVVLYPADFSLPTDAPVKVVLDLRWHAVQSRRRQTVEQVVTALQDLGFREAVGYDHREHTRIVGAIPAGKVESLLKSPDPSLKIWPVQLVEVKRDEVARAFTPPGLPPKEKPHLLKISRELRLRLGQEPDRREQVEVILAWTPRDGDQKYIQFLTQAMPDIQVEDRLGPIVVVKMKLGDIETLAQRDEIIGVRLPPKAWSSIPAPPEEDDHNEALRRWGVNKLHDWKALGKGVRVAVIASDFRAWKRLVGKGLPAGTRLVDLTAERSDTITPEPELPGQGELGAGTVQALALAVAAPEVDLTLVRISDTSPTMLHRVARHIAGDMLPSPALQTRLDELLRDEKALLLQREELEKERQAILASNAEEDELARLRVAYIKRKAESDARHEAIRQRRQRYIQLKQGLRDLRGIRIVSCGLSWPEGYPIDGGSALTRTLNHLQPGSTFWVQSGGDLQGQVWCDLFRDADGNRVMEFADSKVSPGVDRWTHELNFLAWRTHSGKQSLDLPANTRVRLVLSWREYTDRRFLSAWESSQRRSRLNLGLVVLRQRDPEGKALPADDCEVAARTSPGQPALRVDATPDSALYEQELEFTTDAGGRFAVRIEGPGATLLRFQDEATLPTQDRYWELRPRLIVQVVDPRSRGRGRVILLDYSSSEGVVGMPADGHGVLTAGASDSAGKARATSPAGSPLGLRLLRKPELFAPDAVTLPAGPVMVRGSALSAGFAAGVVASALNAGYSTEALFRTWRANRTDRWTPPPRGR